MREAVSLLFSEGHAHANRYPLAKVWYEAQICRERITTKMATETTLMHAMAVAVMSPKGNGVGRLKKMLKELQDGD